MPRRNKSQKKGSSPTGHGAQLSTDSEAAKARTLPRQSFTQVIAPLVIESTKGSFGSRLVWSFHQTCFGPLSLGDERDRAIHPVAFQRRQSFIGLVEGKCCHFGLKMDLRRQVKEIPGVGASHVGHAA